MKRKAPNHPVRRFNSLKEYRMKEYRSQNKTQERPCATTLRRCQKFADRQSDFRGEITLEDGRRYYVGVIVSRDRDGQDVLLLHLRTPRSLAKTPVAGLEVVR
jgi:hypothetical protein